MNKLFLSIFAGALAFATTAHLDAQDASPVAGIGLPAGQKAPDFNLKDQNGREHSLQELTKKGSVALVFYRSADW